MEVEPLLSRCQESRSGLDLVRYLPRYGKDHYLASQYGVLRTPFPCTILRTDTKNPCMDGHRAGIMVPNRQVLDSRMEAREGRLLGIL